MKLKYYFRGIGIGVVVTTIVFMLLISVHKNDGAQGTGLPMQNTESHTVAQTQADTQKAAAETEENTKPKAEAKPQDTQAPSAQGQAAPANPAEEEKPDAQKPADSPEKKAEPADKANPADKADQAEPENNAGPADQAPAEPEPKKEEKVRIEISGGQFSDAVSRKLEEAGLVDSAKAFNDYLVQKDYDDAILPGVYEIPKGATYEEIAVLLTTKV